MVLTESADSTVNQAAVLHPSYPAEVLYATFCQNQVGMVISRQIDGVILENNDAWLNVVEKRREETIGRRLKDLGLVFYYAGGEVGWARLLSGEQVNVEVYNRPDKIVAKSCLVKTSQVCHDGMTYYVTSMLDISERKRAAMQAEESRKLFESFFYEAPTPMLVLATNDLRIINANKAWAAMIRQERSHFLGRRIDSLAAIIANSQKSETIEIMAADSFFCGDFEFITRDDEIRYGRAQIRPVAMSGQECFLVAVEDVTDRRIAEREYIRLSGLNLAGEIAASIGHEVRNPLTTVRGYLQLMGRRAELEDYHQRFDLMIGELDRANHILTEFLSVAKDKKIDRELVNLNEIVVSIIPIMQAAAAMEEKELIFEAGAIPNHYLDPKEMRQLILNLVKNGMEAMPPKGAVTITTQVNRNGDTVLSVKDRGLGIPPEILDRVGQPFFTTKEGGTGLGLAVCYSIARRNHGRVMIDSSPQGTTVWVEFYREAT